jgi:ABC-type nitrate/sulfonate/bicarbonate transport system substrate-binding protein
LNRAAGCDPQDIERSIEPSFSVPKPMILIAGGAEPGITSRGITMRRSNEPDLENPRQSSQEFVMKRQRKIQRAVFIGTIWLALAAAPRELPSQTLDKMHLGYSGTGINNYVLEMGKRLGIFRKNGLDLEIVYVNSGSLLSQALIAGTFDLSMSQGSEAMIAKLRGADVRMVAVIANRFNHVYLAAPSITSFKQLKGKKVAVSRFGSGSHFQTNLALKEGGLDPEKDVTILQIGNSGARITAILSGIVDGTIMAADFVPKAKREGFNVLTDLADTKVEYPFLSLNMLGSYIDKNLKLVKALIKSMSESIRALQTDSANAKAAIRMALKTDDAETIDYALMRSIRVLDRRPFPTPGGIKTVLDELGSEVKGKTLRFEDFVDLRALRELEKEGAFKQ